MLAAASDDRYALAVAVMLHSALASIRIKPHIRIVIVSGGISAANRLRIERVVNESAGESFSIDWHETDVERVRHLKIAWWTSPAAYLRFLIPSFVSDAVPWILYLDSDTLVRSDLSELWTQRHGSHAYVHAVRDYWHPNVGSALGDEVCRSIGIEPTAPYFNSGLMLMNLARWREDTIADRGFVFVDKHAGRLQNPDQDALNVVIGRDWVELDSRWNVMLNALDRYLRSGGELPTPLLRAKLLEHARILHFTGHRKPWRPGYLGALGREYRAALFDSAWFNSPRERVAWKLRFWLLTPSALAKRVYVMVRKRLKSTLRRHTS